MPTITPHEKKQLLHTLIDLELGKKSVHHPAMGYAPSRVRLLLESTHATDDHWKLLKQQLAQKGVTFLETFRNLHALYYWMDLGCTPEIAKKRMRYVLCSKDKEHADERLSFLQSPAINPAHLFLFET